MPVGRAVAIAANGRRKSEKFRGKWLSQKRSSILAMQQLRPEYAARQPIEFFPAHPRRDGCADYASRAGACHDRRPDPGFRKSFVNAYVRQAPNGAAAQS